MPALALVLVGAMFAIAWVLATSGIMEQISQNLAKALPPPPVITWQQIFGAIGSWFSGLGSWVNSHITPLWMSLWAHYDSHLQGVNAHSRMASSTFSAIARVKTVIVPHAIAGEQDARQQADTALWESTVGLAENVQGTALNAVGAERADREAADTTLWDQTVGLAESEEQKISGWVASEASARVAGDLRLEQLLNIDIQTTQDQATAQISAEAGTRAAGEARLQANIDTQGAGLTDLINSTAQGLQSTLESQLAGVAASSAAGLAAQEAEITAIRELDCLKFCTPLAGLGQALEILDVAALLALLGLAVKDPEATASWVAQNLAQPAADALDQAAQLVGLQVPAA